MVDRVILLNGPPGVGKTTVARALAATATNGACVHGDSLRDFIVTRQRGSVRARTTYRAAGRVSAVFIDSGYDLVVVDYVFSKPGHVAEYRHDLARELPLFCFLLWAPLSIVEERERGRENRRRLGKQVAASYATFERQPGALGFTIDTNGREISDIVASIATAVEAGDGRVADPGA